MGSTLFDQFIQDKIYPIFGDLTEPDIGLSELDLDIISNQTNVIFHCAGSMDGNEQVDASVKVR
jgi:thioester reductase-like protein